MKLSKDPFEVAFEEVDDSPPDSPYTHGDNETQTLSAQPTIHSERYGVENSMHPSNQPKARVRAILSQFTEEQMSRYESFRRSGFQKANMKRLLASITGSAKISMPMTIVVSGIAKIFVGELVETAKMIMTERNETGPIRPCHIREAYRRLKLEGKIPKKSLPRLFH
ncbi:TAFII28-like protein [Artemisia annua]|uniref:TAFII28-like protein n=1 Tax=Artemisia annua TaxID=35608 RepID=A0A2U1PMS4_ARTAN|nr:TAFII28-like protein [Artemisia annua]